MHHFAFIAGMGTPEILLLMFLFLLLFGANKIPALARGLGKGIREFKEGVNGLGEELKDDLNKPTERK